MKYFNIINMLCVSALLGACGSSSTTTSTPNPTGDAFINQVSGVTNDANDAAESIDINSMVVTQPEDTEPSPLG
jgi:major membrane immunogen (membrane-anchored lipoprotein)